MRTPQDVDISLQMKVDSSMEHGSAGAIDLYKRDTADADKRALEPIYSYHNDTMTQVTK